MKKAILLFACLASMGLRAQTVTTDQNGNYKAVTSTRGAAPAKDTGKTYTDSKRLVYKVYESSTGKPYILRTSKKTGNIYKQYLKLN